MWNPRMGGEKRRNLMNEQKEKGSPPRGRGKARADMGAARLRWITPAWAGKSLQRSLTMTIFRDHPRVGGEKGAGLLAGFCR